MEATTPPSSAHARLSASQLMPSLSRYAAVVNFAATALAMRIGSILHAQAPQMSLRFLVFLAATTRSLYRDAAEAHVPLKFRAPQPLYREWLFSNVLLDATDGLRRHAV